MSSGISWDWEYETASNRASHSQLQQQQQQQQSRTTAAPVSRVRPSTGGGVVGGGGGAVHLVEESGAGQATLAASASGLAMIAANEECVGDRTNAKVSLSPESQPASDVDQ